MKTDGELLTEKKQEMIFVSPDATIHEAVKIMVVNEIGAILIKDGDDIVGIFTERDLLKNAATENFDCKTARIKDFMTKKLQSADYTCNMFQLKDKFLGMHLRHLLITKDEEYIGLLSAGDVARVSLNEKTEELEKLNQLVSWEYYENWRFKKK